MASKNYLQLENPSMAFVRFVIGSEVFVNLICQNAVDIFEEDKLRCAEISKLLTKKHLSLLSQHFSETTTVANFIVWDDELLRISTAPINPALSGVYFRTVQLPLPDLIREIYVIRGTRMMSDLLKGAVVVLKKGNRSLALLMPACSSLIMQTTADEEKAADESIVMGFAMSFLLNWMELHLRVREALT